MTETEVINTYAANSTRCLKRAFARRCPRIARELTALGRRVSDRTVRKMTEENPDIMRRNAIENTVLLIGAAYRTDRKSFKVIREYFEAFFDDLDRQPDQQFPDIETALVEMRFRVISAERIFYLDDRSKMPEAVERIDESLKGMQRCLALKA